MFHFYFCEVKQSSLVNYFLPSSLPFEFLRFSFSFSFTFTFSLFFSLHILFLNLHAKVFPMQRSANTSKGPIRRKIPRAVPFQTFICFVATMVVVLYVMAKYNHPYLQTHLHSLEGPVCLHVFISYFPPFSAPSLLAAKNVLYKRSKHFLANLFELSCKYNKWIRHFKPLVESHRRNKGYCIYSVEKLPLPPSPFDNPK